MNSWIRLGLVVIIGVFLLRFAFGVLAGAMTLIKFLFPIALVAGQEWCCMDWSKKQHGARWATAIGAI